MRKLVEYVLLDIDRARASGDEDLAWCLEQSLKMALDYFNRHSRCVFGEVACVPPDLD